MLNYNAPISGSKSSIDGSGSDQTMSFYWLRKSIIEARKEQFFMPLASVTNMPKHMGKTIKVFEYVPLLDERNINSQGIDAAGATILSTEWVVTFPATVLVTSNATKVAVAAAINDDVANSVTATAGADNSASAGFANVTLSAFTGATNTGVYLEAKKTTVLAAVPDAYATQGSGNLYGSSKDIGTITAKLPALGETGGRVNRVGFTRLQREGSITKFGFFTEFTRESLDFDSDEELMSHLSRELMNGATQLTEATLQMDLLAAAGVVLYAGAATSDATISGEGTISKLSYANLMRMDRLLTDNRTPNQTTVITGSRYIDTKVVPNARIAYVGADLMPVLRGLTDLFNNAAFIEVQHYADAGTVLNGEVGAACGFRFVRVPEMLKWAGAGAEVGTNPGYQETSGNYDIFPVLVVGEASFTTIGFQTDGKSVKFDVTTKMPGKEMADRNDPYGETGFSSIKWYYGTLILRPERIGLIKTIAPV